MFTLMTHLELGRSNADLLSLTADLAHRFEAEVIGVAACQPIQILYGEVYVAGELMQIDREESVRQMAEAEAAFRAALEGKVPRLDFRTTVTCLPLSHYIAGQARGADLILTAPDIGGQPFEQTRRTAIADLVLAAGRPVLIAAPHTSSLDLDHALVAWKDTRESRRAVFDALPLLKRAGSVSVVEIAGLVDMADAEAHVDDVAAWLGRHGVKAAARAVKSEGEAAHQLGAIADETGSGVIVAGAYGHTRFREWVLGGVTRELLMHPKHCAFVSH